MSGSGATAATRTGVGFYDVTFNRAVNTCLPLATLGSDTLFYIPRPVSLTVNASTVRVRVINVDGSPNDAGVYLAVFC